LHAYNVSHSISASYNNRLYEAASPQGRRIKERTILKGKKKKEKENIKIR